MDMVADESTAKRARGLDRAYEILDFLRRTRAAANTTSSGSINLKKG
jgi:hypothetical protein